MECLGYVPSSASPASAVDLSSFLNLILILLLQACSLLHDFWWRVVRGCNITSRHVTEILQSTNTFVLSTLLWRKAQTLEIPPVRFYRSSNLLRDFKWRGLLQTALPTTKRINNQNHPINLTLLYGLRVVFQKKVECRMKPDGIDTDSSAERKWKRLLVTMSIRLHERWLQQICLFLPLKTVTAHIITVQCIDVTVAGHFIANYPRETPG